MRLAGKLAALSATLAAGLLASLAGCLLDLPSVCGDGIVDLDSGEECDPAANNGPFCDPVKCTLVAVPTCGNGKIDAIGEECDLAEFGTKDCPSGKGYLLCTDDCKLDESKCDQCGNGIVDAEVGEECDPKANNTDFKQPTECSELATYADKPYTSGQTITCVRDTCLWYRGACGFCGDNKTDHERIVDINYPQIMSERESCDGKDVDIEEFAAYCGTCAAAPTPSARSSASTPATASSRRTRPAAANPPAATAPPPDRTPVASPTTTTSTTSTPRPSAPTSSPATASKHLPLQVTPRPPNTEPRPWSILGRP
jgi:hypothetical protein